MERDFQRSKKFWNNFNRIWNEIYFQGFGHIIECDQTDRKQSRFPGKEVKKRTIKNTLGGVRMSEEKKMVENTPEEQAAAASPKLRIENNLPVGSARNLEYDINQATSTGSISPGKNIVEITPFQNDFPSSFNLTGNNTPDHVISYEYRNCTHGIEIINTQTPKPMKVRAVPVLPFQADIDPNVFNIVKAHQISPITDLENHGGRDIPTGIEFKNELKIPIKIEILFSTGVENLDLRAGILKEYDDSLGLNKYVQFQVVEAKCPVDQSCPIFATCQYPPNPGKPCHYHLEIAYKYYSVKVRIDDIIDSHHVLQFIGSPPQPGNINITIQPDIP